MIYERSCKMLLDMISYRIKAARKELNLTNKDICRFADPNLVSAIVNNRIDRKKNPYLIPNSIVDVSGRTVIEEIAANLKMKSVDELILGTDEELEAYSGHLFDLLINDALNDEGEKTKSVIDDCLSDYIYYSIASSYNCAKAKHGDDVDVAVDCKFRDILDPDDYVRGLAVARIYSVIKDEFEYALREFIKKTPNTIKLNKRLSEFLRNEMIPIIEGNRRNNPLINNIKKDLLFGYEAAVYNLNESLAISPEAVYYHENDRSQYERYNMSSWFDALIEYAIKLGSIQDDDEGVPDLDLIVNHWNLDMFAELRK